MTELAEPIKFVVNGKLVATLQTYFTLDNILYSGKQLKTKYISSNCILHNQLSNFLKFE